MSYALLSRISSANYKPSVSQLPHTVTSVLAFWCVAILIQVEGLSQSSLQPIDPQEVFKPSLMQFYPETCQCWLMRAVRPQCGQGGEAEQPFALCALWNAPSAQPAQEKSRGHSCPALSSQLTATCTDPGGMLMLLSSPSQSGGACLLHLLV